MGLFLPFKPIVGEPSERTLKSVCPISPTPIPSCREPRLSPPEWTRTEGSASGQSQLDILRAMRTSHCVRELSGRRPLESPERERGVLSPELPWARSRDAKAQGRQSSGLGVGFFLHDGRCSHPGRGMLPE